MSLGLMDSGEKMSVVIDIYPSRGHIHDRCLLTLERGYLFATFPGKSIFDIKPKEYVRKDPNTLRVNTGFWSWGWLTLIFDSTEDADRVESELKKLVPQDEKGD